MELDKFNINDYNEISELSNSSIKLSFFDHITEIIQNAFEKLGINTDEMFIYYQRYENSTSILAIKVSHGDDNDINNYMFIGCSAHNKLCDVYMHSEAKSAKKSMDISNLISMHIASFFEKLELDLFKNNQSNIEISIKIPLEKKEEKVLTPKESKVKKLIRSIFQK